MSFTVNDALTSVAYRIGFDTIPQNTAEKNRWIAQCDDAQRSIIRKNFYWFTQDTKSLTTINGKKRYDLDTTFRQAIDVRLNGLAVHPITQHEQSANYNATYSGVALSPSSSRYSLSYYLFGEQELVIIPETTTAPTAITPSSITRSSTLVTVTTSEEHGYLVDDFVTVSGAVETDYNGAWRIYSVPSSTTFTYEVTTTPTSPATGTLSVIKRDLVYSFYKLPTRITSLTDTLLIPDLFFESFVSYVKARLDLRDGKRGSAGDGFDEFNTLIEDLDIENNKRLWSNVNINTY